MKSLILFLILLVSTNISAQTPNGSDSTLTAYKANITTDTTKTVFVVKEITYVTPDKDTMYVVAEMYQIMSLVWNEPYYAGERPVLIPVQSIKEIRESSVAKRED